jgi:hypothetical protein
MEFLSTFDDAHGTIWVFKVEALEVSHMSMQSHLLELQKRHEALEQQIAEALLHPSTDDLTLRELKRRKLYVKDEIMRLQHVESVH